MSAMVAHPLVDVMHREVAKFLAISRRRSEHDIYLGRRASRRHYRNWPLLVAPLGRPDARDVSAALYNASESGLAFRSARAFKPGSRLAVKLFWHEARAFRVPVTVRHCQPAESGFIIGCEFAFEDAGLCEMASVSRTHWYDCA
jgi:hypothetical protein